jgi:hypothetical protein
MPVGCGVWPAIWTTNDAEWPRWGEIDIVEVANNAPYNVMTLHTNNATSVCTLSGSDESGVLLSNDCGTDPNSGCSVQDENDLSAGAVFNTHGGGVYVLEWTTQFIRIWFFTRSSIPASITKGEPDPDTFGPAFEYELPTANFQSFPDNSSCPIDEHFQDHNIVIDIDFCGDLAGTSWCESNCASASDKSTCGIKGDPNNPSYSNKTMQRCAEFVANSPEAFEDAFWEFNSIKVYQQSQKPPYIGQWPSSSVEPVYSSWYHPGHGHAQKPLPTIPPGYAWQYNPGGH